jgi:aldehyde dehydrogenase (NAD+)
VQELSEFYIDGQWVKSASGDRHALIDPSTEEQIGTVALGTVGDVDAAVAAASSAFPGWAFSDLADRVAAVERLRHAYEARLEDMAQAISREMGAPIDLARQRQAPAALRHIDTYLAAIESFSFERMLSPHAPHDRILMEPIGVVGMVTPWNWPMSQIALKVVPALLVGCTMVLKPSEYAPFSSALLAEIVDAAKIPAGVFNLVHGDGMTAGTRLVEHPDVAMISFTGSTRAGAAIVKRAADTFKRVGLELGGKGANLIFPDADADAVARGVKTCFINSGQNCNAPTRMLVQRAVYDEAVEQAREAAESLAVGPSNQEGGHMGPVVSARQYERIQSYIEEGVAEGARLVAGGSGRPAGFNRGFFVQPTVFADVTSDMTIAREEIFGPVLSIMPFDDEEEALSIANDTPYGLTNYVQSADGARRNRMARRLRSGMVEMNGQPRAAGSPFGGVGHSGLAREGGVFGLEEFLVIKSVSGWGGDNRS